MTAAVVDAAADPVLGVALFALLFVIVEDGNWWVWCDEFAIWLLCADVAVKLSVFKSGSVYQA